MSIRPSHHNFAGNTQNTSATRMQKMRERFNRWEHKANERKAMFIERQKARIERYKNAFAGSWITKIGLGMVAIWNFITNPPFFVKIEKRPAVAFTAMMPFGLKVGRRKKKDKKGKRRQPRFASTGGKALIAEQLEQRQLLAVDLPAFPPVGGVDVVGTGAVAEASGREFDFDLSANPYTTQLNQVDTLYYGLYSLEAGLAGDSNAVAFEDSHLVVSGNTATWTRSDIPYTFQSGNGLVTGRLVLTFSDASDSTILSDVDLPAGYSIPSGNNVHGRPHTDTGAVLAVRESDQDFTANIKFEINDGGSWAGPTRTLGKLG